MHELGCENEASEERPTRTTEGRRKGREGREGRLIPEVAGRSRHRKLDIDIAN